MLKFLTVHRSAICYQVVNQSASASSLLSILRLESILKRIGSIVEIPKNANKEFSSLST